GAPAAQAVARAADEQRAAQRRTATAAARRVGVRATVPLGLCFLPAFLLIGVVPIVIGLTSTLLRPV
ncbi:type II secretion protein F, partial [Streptomyces sp. SID3343]|nr:type II secretion protein F [Streptomyces sp. SID3343]